MHCSTGAASLLQPTSLVAQSPAITIATGPSDMRDDDEGTSFVTTLSFQRPDHAAAAVADARPKCSSCVLTHCLACEKAKANASSVSRAATSSKQPAVGVGVDWALGGVASAHVNAIAGAYCKASTMLCRREPCQLPRAFGLYQYQVAHVAEQRGAEGLLEHARRLSANVCASA
eukprot:SM000173S03042  [mRNA]  locus=s173:302322:303043:+ [translate_table: standard]